jgi:maltose 6'-phosphate phosphatase
MKFQLDLQKLIFSLVVLFVFLFHTNSSLAEQAQCSDVWDRGHLNVLTINLALFEIARRDERLENLADFAEIKALDGEPVDVILLQEGIAGDLVDTNNGSPSDLQEKLRNRGLTYDLETAIETGIPGILTTGNAILSRCEIGFKFFKFLPITSEKIELEGIGGLDIPITRNVMIVRIKIPGAPNRFSKINVYNTHLCAGGSNTAEVEGIDVNTRGCTVDEREHQLVKLLEFTKAAERFFSFFIEKPHVLGGDFNIDNFRGGEAGQFGNEKALYDTIIGSGFVDAYAQSQIDIGVLLQDLCARSEDPFEPFQVRFPGIFQDWEPDVHCTKGVSFLDVNGPFPQFFDTTPRRIDYIFQKGFTVGNGEVVFNSNASPPKPLEPIVSDHAGVLVRILLQ